MYRNQVCHLCHLQCALYFSCFVGCRLIVPISKDEFICKNKMQKAMTIAVAHALTVQRFQQYILPFKIYFHSSFFHLLMLWLGLLWWGNFFSYSK